MSKADEAANTTLFKIMHLDNRGQSVSVPRIGKNGQSMNVRFNEQGVAMVRVSNDQVKDGAVPIFTAFTWKHQQQTDGDAGDGAEKPGHTRSATSKDMAEEIEGVVAEIERRDKLLEMKSQEIDELKAKLTHAEQKLGQLNNADRTETDVNLKQTLNNAERANEEMQRRIQQLYLTAEMVAKGMNPEWNKGEDGAIDKKADPAVYVSQNAKRYFDGVQKDRDELLAAMSRIEELTSPDKSEAKASAASASKAPAPAAPSKAAPAAQQPGKKH